MLVAQEDGKSLGVPISRGPEKNKPRGLHAHKHKIRTPLILFITIIIGLLLAGGGLFYIQNKAYISETLRKDNPSTFSIDHLLLKMLLKEREFAEQEVRVMNIADAEQEFSMTPEGLKDIVSLDASHFSLGPGQTKVVRVTFRTADTSSGIEQQPGIYIGSIIVETKKSLQRMPLIAEIESKNVLFDANLNPVSLDRNVGRGEDFVVEVRLFNLQTIDAEKVDMKYVVKDIRGNTLITESETVVVKTQASFFKTVSVPKNLAPGTYIFGVETRLGNSVGTSSYLFEVVDASQQGAKGIVDFCKNDRLCSGLSIAVIALLLAVAAYFYLFLGAFFYEKASSLFSPLGKERERRVEEVVVKGKGWLATWREERRKSRAEHERTRRLDWERRKKEDLAKHEQQLREQREKEKYALMDQRSRQREEMRTKLLDGRRKVQEERLKKEEERREAEQEREGRLAELRVQKEEELRKREEEKSILEKERAKQREENRIKRIEERRKTREEQRKGEEEARILKARQELEREKQARILGKEKLKLQKRQQRIEMLKLLLFGRKEEKGKVKPSSTKRVVELDKRIDSATESIKKENLKKSRQEYARIIRKYHSLGLEEKKAIYGRITSLYKKIVEQENKFHTHSKEEKEKQEAERKQLEEEKKQHQALMLQQREELARQREMQKSMAAEEKQKIREDLKKQKEEFRQKAREEEQKKFGQERANRQKELEEDVKKREQEREERQKESEGEEKKVQKLEEEKQGVLNSLATLWGEFNSLMATLPKQAQLLEHKLAELRNAHAIVNRKKQEAASIEGSGPDKAQRELSEEESEAQQIEFSKNIKHATKKERMRMLKEADARARARKKSEHEQKMKYLNNLKKTKKDITDAEKGVKSASAAFTSVQKKENYARENLGGIQKHIIELQHKRSDWENALLAQKRKVERMKGGFGTFSALLIPSHYQPSSKDQLMIQPIVPEFSEGGGNQEQFQEKPVSESKEDSAEEEEDIIEFEEQQEKTEETKESPEEQNYDLEKKSALFLKYAGMEAQGRKQLLKGDTPGARKSYLKARKIYLKLEYHERKEVYEGLNSLYNSLAVELKK